MAVGVGVRRIALRTVSGRYQFQRSSFFIVAGTSRARTIGASRRIAADRPMPNSWRLTKRPEVKPEKAAIMMIVAAVMVRPVCWRP